MGLNGYMLWVMGQLDLATCRAQPRRSAIHVAFERAKGWNQEITLRQPMQGINIAD
jgi:hypothetical protein